MLDLEDVTGRRVIATRLLGNVVVGEDQAAAALEAMSRFAVDPRWLVYLPPTMSPSETSREPGLLEHPAEAFAHFRAEAVERVVCEEKHMGSRAVVVVCRDAAAAERRFGVSGPEAARGGIVFTRTGRRFFEDRALEAGLLGRLRIAIDASGLWDELQSDWLLLDAELMPWSAKVLELVRQQYAAVGAARAQHCRRASTSSSRRPTAASTRAHSWSAPATVPPWLTTTLLPTAVIAGRWARSTI